MDPYKVNYVMPLMIGILFTCVGAGICLVACLARRTEGTDITSHLPWYMWMNRLAASSWIIPMCFGVVFVMVGLSVAIFVLLGAKKVDYIIPLMIGVLLICVGVGFGLAACLARRMEGTDITWHLPSHMKKNRLEAFSRIFIMCFGAVFVVLGLTVTIGYLSGPSPEESRRHDQYIVSLTAAEVRSVVLDRDFKNLYVDQSLNLVQKPIEITDKGDVASICTALRSAKLFSPYRPNPRWYCPLTLHTPDGPIEIRVERSTHQGVILWLRQEYRCDEMGTVLESIAKKHDSGKLTPTKVEERQRESDHNDMICAEILLGVFALGAAFFFLALPVLPIWRICRRVGLPPAMGLFMLLPVANVILRFVIGFQKWPIIEEMKRHQVIAEQNKSRNKSSTKVCYTFGE